MMLLTQFIVFIFLRYTFKFINVAKGGPIIQVIQMVHLFRHFIAFI